MTDLKVIKMPGTDLHETNEVLDAACKAKLPNVIVLSQLENGDIYHDTSNSMTLSEANWIIDSFKMWLMRTAGKK